jgi:hypothetical protein
MSNGYALPVREPESQQSVRLGRCANHIGMPAVGTCDVCGKSICVSCAIPVRGRLVCHDCLSTVLEDAPPTPPPSLPLPRPGGGDALAIAGFGLVVVLSIFPWTRFGDRSGYFEAWFPHWSLIAAAGSMLGIVLAVRALLRPLDPRLVAAAHAGLALIVGAAIVLHRQHPPGAPLATGAAASRLALLGAAIALAGGVWKGATLIRARSLLS